MHVPGIWEGWPEGEKGRAGSNNSELDPFFSATLAPRDVS
jgi:hypothetical protein